MSDTSKQQGWTWWNLLPIVAFCVIGIVAFGVLAQPLIEDEVEFAEIARSYITHGSPLAHVAGNVEPVLHHPQLYHLLLAIASLAGGPQLGGRLFGIACLLISAWLAARLSRKICSIPHVGQVAAAMVLLCPLCARGALLLDIDNTLLPTLCLWFLLVAMSPSRHQKLILTGIFALGLWTKLTTPFLLVIPLWILWGSHRWREVLLIPAFGVILFMVSWAIFCWAQALDPMSPIWHLITKATSSMALYVGNPAAVLGKRLLQYILWLSPFLVGLIFMPKIKPQVPRAASALVGFVIAVFLCYWFVGGVAFGFPRYQLPAVIITMVLLAPGIIKGWQDLPTTAVGRWLFLIIGSAFLLSVTHDVLYPFYTYPEKSAMGLIGNLDLIFHLFRVIAATLSIWVVMFLLWKRSFSSLRQGIVMISAAILLPWWVSQDLAIASAKYNTAYLYGETGILEAADILTKSLPKGAEIIASKDVAYHCQYHFPHQVLGAVCQRGDLTKTLSVPHVSAMVYRHGQWIDAITGPCLQSPQVQDILISKYQSCHAGDFQIYLKRQHAKTDKGNTP
jgi:hypothetical protein